jgi:hypothetical protein
MLISLAKVAPSAFAHGAGMLLKPALNPQQLSTKKLANILSLEASQLEGYQWELVHQGTTSRWRLHLPQLDKVLFAKTNPPDVATRFFGAMFQLGINELGFYRDIQSQLSIPTPSSHGLFGDRFRYLILIDDLGGKAEFTDLSSRCDLRRAQAVIDTLAHLHASCWQDSRFENQWRWVNRQQYKRNHAFLTILREQSSIAAVKRYRDLLPEGMPELASVINAAYPSLEREWGVGERTLVHGDSHIGNMYFLPGSSEEDGSGRKTELSAGLLDWQVLGFEHSMRDITYFMINSLPTELRQQHQQKLIQRYVDKLADLNVQLPLALAEDQYRLHASYAWISSAVTAASNTMQEEKIAAAGLIRASKAMIDLEVGERLAHLS